MEYPIDLVYLWVDGADPKWCARKNNYLLLADAAEHNLAVPERWKDNDELKYSLRGVERFIPWLNHIFLVTDQQVPSWLNTNHPKLTVVDHRDFIPQEYLPLFCSDALESFLPCVPNLSEHFLFANDDTFFGREISPKRFFDRNGNPIVQVKRLYEKDFFQDRSLQEQLLSDKQYASRTRSNLLVSNKFQKNLNWEGAHVIDPYRKSYMLETLQEASYAEAWEASRRHRFRSPEVVQRIIFSLYDFCKGRTTLIDSRHLREWKRIFCPQRLPYLLSKESDLQKVLRIRPEMFCYYVGDYKKALHDFFESYFPLKSSFEI